MINDCQVDFTRKARTSYHIKTIIDKYCNSMDGRVFACFVDFQKAFDTVIHTGIKIKLLRIGVGKISIKLLSKAFIHQVNLVFGSII